MFRSAAVAFAIWRRRESDMAPRGPLGLQRLIGFPEHAAHTQIHPDVSSMARIRINPSSRVSPCHKCSVEIAVIMSDVNYEQRAEVCRRLAKLDWEHFSGMARTWELLAAQRQTRL